MDSLVDTVDAGAQSEDANNDATGQAPEATETQTADADKAAADKENEAKARGKYANKYDTAEDLEKGYKEQTKAVKDLQKQLKEVGEKHEIPEDFDINVALKEVQGLPEGAEVDPNDPVFAHMMPVIKDMGLSKENATHLAAEFVKMQLAEMPDSEEEMAALGPTGKAELAKIGKVMEQLPAEQAEILRSFTTRADEVNAIVEFAKLYNPGEKNIPANQAPTPSKTAVELKQDAQDFKRKNEKSISFNKDQQDHYNSLMRQALSAEEFEKKNR